jgi:hypothetical protein
VRVAGSTRTDGSARISHSEFAIDKRRIVGVIEPSWQDVELKSDTYRDMTQTSMAHIGFVRKLAWVRVHGWFYLRLGRLALSGQLN